MLSFSTASLRLTNLSLINVQPWQTSNHHLMSVWLVLQLHLRSVNTLWAHVQIKVPGSNSPLRLDSPQTDEASADGALRAWHSLCFRHVIWQDQCNKIIPGDVFFSHWLCFPLIHHWKILLDVSIITFLFFVFKLLRQWCEYAVIRSITNRF